jgi:hypothetical protein
VSKKSLGQAQHWNELELDRQAEITAADIEAARTYVRSRKRLKRIGRLLEARAKANAQ